MASAITVRGGLEESRRISWRQFWCWCAGNLLLLKEGESLCHRQEQGWEFQSWFVGCRPIGDRGENIFLELADRIIDKHLRRALRLTGPHTTCGKCADV